MNLLHTTNAKQGPHDNYNAYSEFNDKETDAQICAAAMKHFGISRTTGKYPNISKINWQK